MIIINDDFFKEMREAKRDIEEAKRKEKEEKERKWQKSKSNSRQT